MVWAIYSYSVGFSMLSCLCRNLKYSYLRHVGFREYRGDIEHFERGGLEFGRAARAT